MISIIITNYNGLKWLKKCLDSLFSQTYNDFEIILVDNESTDDSIKFLEENYRDERLKIVRSEKNLGFAGGNNLGFNNSKGEYILLLNNDTWVENDFLKELFDFYIKNDFEILSCLGISYEKKEIVYKKTYGTIDILGNPIALENKNREDFLLCGACLFFKSNFYKETLGLDNDFFMYSEEIDWIWRIFLLGKKTFACDNIFYHHFGMGSTTNMSRLDYKIFLWRNQNLLQMLIKNYSWYNLLWVLPLYILQNIFEVLFFLLILKPKIASSYIDGWMFNIININKTLEKRRWIQKNRIISDLEIFKKMYFGSGKLKHLIGFIKNKL